MCADGFIPLYPQSDQLKDNLCEAQLGAAGKKLQIKMVA